MSQRALAVDTWIREAQEALKLVEDVESKSKNQSRSGQRLSAADDRRTFDIARSKLLEVGVKLDRLESLLHNPPSKPILTEEDLEYRWKMLSDIRLRTRILAQSLYPLSPQKLPGDSLASPSKEFDGDTNRNIKDEAESNFPIDDAGVQKPLLNLPAQSHGQIKRNGSCVLKRIIWKISVVVFAVLGGALLLFLLFVITAMI